MNRFVRSSAGLLTLVALLAACGDKTPTAPSTVVSATTVAGPAGSTVAVAGKQTGAAGDLQSMKGAIVQIIVEGEIRDPEVGSTGFSSSGSGFLIDDSGTIVTNNHVVTGSGAISVLVGGDRDNPYPAKVLGVSECSDLAVIKMSGPGPFPYLKWSDKKVEPPLEIYAAGFPLGDPEYTVTRGVVSKAKADGDTNWASVLHVIEHDANIQPGNSGGPLVDKDGAVIGINYAGGDTRDTGTAQFFAIANDLGKPTVDLLIKGDQESIGVNGRAFVNQEQKLAGVFVRGVAPGGPASEAEVKPGDIITTLNGVDLGGGTLGQYCKVLRSARDGAPISIRVVRFDTSEVLEGELNGKPLKPVFSFAQELKTEVPAGAGGGTPVESGNYTTITDETGRLKVDMPVEWTDTRLNTQDLLEIGTQQPTIIAAPNINEFDNGDGAGSALVLIDLKGVASMNKDELLDAVEDGLGCEPGKRADLSDDRYTGRYLAAKCGDTLAIVALVSRSGDPDKALLLLSRAVTDADLAAIDRQLSSVDFN